MPVRRSLIATVAFGFAVASSAARAQQNDVAPVEPATSHDPAQPDPPELQRQLAWFPWWATRGWLAPRGPSRELARPFPEQSQEELDYLDRLLTHWETRSSEIRRYRADFRRWVADPVFGPAETFKTYSTGVIRYEAPDKGLFRFDSTGQWTPPSESGARPSYPDLGDGGREHWVCDGKSLFEFNYAAKTLVERELPPELQGKALAQIPLPIAFGATRESIKGRYWLRVTTTPEAQARNEYWLEAWPKRCDDAANYSRIEIVIDRSDFLTSAIRIHERNGVETIYQFMNRSTNWTFDPLDAAESEDWRRAFDPPTPCGWERLREAAPGDPAK